VTQPAAGIELRGAVKRHRNGASVGPIDLTVNPGEIVALVGESGSGKSTILRLVLGLLVPEAGEVLVGGRPVREDDAFRRSIGYVVQGGALFPHLTGAENASLVARRIGWDDRRVASRLHELERLVHLVDSVLGRFPREISGGQAQRIGLIRALFLDPAILLLDEPLGALDPLTRAALQEDLLRVFVDLGKTVVLVTHDLAEAALFAHRIVLLRDGAVAQAGTLEDLALRPADEFVSRFVHAHRAVQLPGEDPS
jgi:osmoprotectant transport system ATP-binding protein